MEKAASLQLSIRASWEHLDAGSPEERACFAGIGIHWNNQWLTEGRDGLVNRTRPTPLLSAYHLAEWIAWNWWRLRWEPRANSTDWAFAHRLATIGEGYVWPNITIFSDGERIAMIAKPTEERDSTPFRYISNTAAVVPAREFEGAVGLFLTQVLSQLREEEVAGTNLAQLWAEVLDERQDPEIARRRKLEALLGREPGEVAGSQVDQLLADAATLGESAIEEIAAEGGQSGVTPTARELRSMAHQFGAPLSLSDSAALHAETHLTPWGQVAAWRLGAEAARALRIQERVVAGELLNKQLAEMVGVLPSTITPDVRRESKISFALIESAQNARVVLRSKWETGRRFELGRILGDRILGQHPGNLFPATRSYTYRQKMQRSFSTELLCPFDELDEMLNGDYSLERQQEAAERYNVSPLMIRTQLVNHNRLEREELDGDFEAAAVAA